MKVTQQGRAWRAKMRKIPYMLGIWMLVGNIVAALAAPVGMVDAVQFPAWLDRAGLSVPISPDIELQAGDAVRTGAGARLIVKLGEGGLVKLGENTHVVIDRVQSRGSASESVLSVVSGVFRLTTGAQSRSSSRDMTINIARNAAISARDADLWGRSREDGDMVCLIEGQIEIIGNDRKILKLDQPLQSFQSTRTAPPEPRGLLTRQEFDVLAAETEMEFGKGATPKGNWKVVIAGFATRAEAREAARNLRTNGYPAEVTADNTLTVARMDGELAARQLAARLKAGSGFPQVRIAQ